MTLEKHLIVHRGRSWILLRFSPNEEWNRRMRAVPGCLWSKTHRGWLVPDSEENRNRCGMQLTAMQLRKLEEKPPLPVLYPTKSRLSPENSDALEEFLRQLDLKKYSPSTIRTYGNEFVQLLYRLGPFPARDLTAEQLKRYIHWCVREGYSEHTLHSRINALKFYYEAVLHRNKMFFDIPRPRKPFQLPKVLSKEEIASIIKCIRNIKHRTMIMLAYGCGLRVSEITRLEITDIDGPRRLLLIRRGKGKKDRVVSLSPALLIMLREYYKKSRPTHYLFEGQQPGSSYSVRSLEEIIHQAKARAGISKEGSMHMLRHSFATHLLDKGTDVVMIQKLLGHNDIRTTLRYLHVTNKDLLNILSPIEDIKDLLTDESPPRALSQPAASQKNPTRKHLK